jgi:hypothetical protein
MWPANVCHHVCGVMALRSSFEEPAQCRVSAALCSPRGIRYPRSHIDRQAQSDDRQIGVVVEDAALKKSKGSNFIRKPTVNALHLIKPAIKPAPSHPLKASEHRLPSLSELGR